MISDTDLRKLDTWTGGKISGVPPNPRPGPIVTPHRLTVAERRALGREAEAAFGQASSSGGLGSTLGRAGEEYRRACRIVYVFGQRNHLNGD